MPTSKRRLYWRVESVSFSAPQKKRRLAAKPYNSWKAKGVLGIGLARIGALVYASCAERGVLQRDRFFLLFSVLGAEFATKGSGDSVNYSGRRRLPEEMAEWENLRGRTT